MRYGADEHGLVYGYRFAPDGTAELVDLARAVEWLHDTGAEADRGFLWLHFNLAVAPAHAWIERHLPVAPEFFAVLRQDSRSTRIEDADEDLVAVVNDVAYEFSFDPAQTATLWLDVNARVAVSARVHPVRSIDQLRQAVKDGARLASPVALLNHLLSDQGDVLVRIVREATLKVDRVEDGMMRGRLKDHRGQLSTLRRVLVRLQRLLAPEPAALFRLLRQPPAWITSADLEALRQATEEFSLVLRDLAALQERIKLLQEEIAAQVSEQTNRSLFTLTVVTVLALPINITTGFFGMNVGGVPLADSPHGFLVMALGVGGVTAVAGWLTFRRRD